MDNEAASTLEQIQIDNYLHLFAITFLFWDHIITLPDEVKYVWKRSKISSSYWFFLNRYFTPLANISVLALLFINLSESRFDTFTSRLAYILRKSPVLSCRTFTLYRQILLIFNQVLVGVLLTIRIYALYSQSKKVLAYMLTSGAILAGVACYVLFGQEDPSPSIGSSGCHLGLTRTTAIRLAAAWEALFVYDTILFVLTLHKTWRERPRRRGIVMTEGRVYLPLLSLILRDGAIYYAVMALANLVNILTFYFAGPFNRGSLSTFSSCIATTLMSRLMLNLHCSSPNQGLLSTMSITGNMVFGSNTTSTDVELDTFNSNDFGIPSIPLRSETTRTEIRNDDSII